MTLLLSLARLRFSVPQKLYLASFLTVLGDWLLFNQKWGISLALFFLALGMGTAITGPVRATWRQFTLACVVLLAFLLPIIESLGTLSFLFGLAGSVLFALMVSGGLRRGWKTACILAALVVFTGPLRLVPDLVQYRRRLHRQNKKLLHFAAVLGWIVPVAFCLVFVILLASANPLIEQVLEKIDPVRLFSMIDISRLSFWLIIISVAWAFIAVIRYRKSRQMIPSTAPSVEPADSSFVRLSDKHVGEVTIFRSLVLFNLLFAVQSVLDAVYLWGGVALPGGMSYASYAHRGAYPLIATALLAACFVLVTMRPGGAGERSPIIRGLVYLWIGQNILLVISSMLRLDLYVEVYSLTMLRVAAFIWMLLVIIGLGLIIARIILRRSNAWLISANLLALTSVLYISAVVNFEAIIADYNVSHARNPAENYAGFDYAYARSLGLQAIPAIDEYLRLINAPDDCNWASSDETTQRVNIAEDCVDHDASGHCRKIQTQEEQQKEKVYRVNCRQVLYRNLLASDFMKKNRNWRQWGYRDTRLLNYLKHNTEFRRFPSVQTVTRASDEGGR